MLMDFDTRNYKKKLNIGKKVNNEAVSNLTDEDFNDVFITLDDISSDTGDISNNLVFKYDLPISGTKKTSSTVRLVRLIHLPPRVRTRKIKIKRPRVTVVITSTPREACLPTIPTWKSKASYIIFLYR